MKLIMLPSKRPAAKRNVRGGKQAESYGLKATSTVEKQMRTLPISTSGRCWHLPGTSELFNDASS